MWDVLGGECEQKYRFPRPVLKVQFEPRSQERLLVCPMRHAAVLVDTGGGHRVVPIDEDVSNVRESWGWKGLLSMMASRYHRDIFRIFDILCSFCE